VSNSFVDPTARMTYASTGLPDVMPDAPLPLIEQWYADAVEDERIDEPGAIAVATVDAAGAPDARTVLLKGLDAQGPTFYTNLGSTKSLELEANPVAAIVFLWHPMFRQVRLRGPVEPVTRAESAAYFASRPRGSQVASRASHQSQPIGSRADLQALVDAEEARWPDTGSPTDVPLPDYWGGFRMRPVEVEFWAGQPSRLHDRMRYTAPAGARLDDPGAWTSVRLQP
jgi:pyridoxamine 5'-phosphate oxidase